MERCYVHIKDDHDSGAWAGTGKSLVATDQSKKRAGSSEANEGPEDSTKKRRQTMLDWSEDEEEKDTSAYMLNPRRKRSEQTMQGLSSPPIKGPQEKQMPPVGPTPSVRIAKEETRPPPQDGGQGSSAQRSSQGQPRRHAFTTIHQSSDL
jgi:hypothetical protein